MSEDTKNLSADLLIQAIVLVGGPGMLKEIEDRLDDGRVMGFCPCQACLDHNPDACAFKAETGFDCAARFNEVAALRNRIDGEMDWKGEV